MERAWIEVNFNNLRSNYELIKEMEPQKEVLAVVKADAYGCGTIAVVKELRSYGVKMFGVSCLQEAMELRDNGIEEDILIFGAIPHSQYRRAFENRIQLTIAKKEDIEFIERNNFITPKVQMKIDTGMGRIGFLVEEGLEILNKREELKKVDIIGVFTHFSCADIEEEDEYTRKQIELFEIFQEVQGLKQIHSQNTGGIIRFNKECKGNIVRPGMLLYGYTNLDKRVKPIATLKAIVTHIKELKDGSFISYGKEKYLEKGSTVATVSIGYADGYPRAFSNCGEMKINGVICKVVGKVCMDVTMVEVPFEYKERVQIGDEVEVISGDIYRQFERADISPYEFLVRIPNRAKRVYIK